jgi:hypothetical protein
MELFNELSLGRQRCASDFIGWEETLDAQFLERNVLRRAKSCDHRKQAER